MTTMTAWLANFESNGLLEFAENAEISGAIVFEGKKFKSPSAFSVFVKRKLNPARKADDGKNLAGNNTWPEW